MGTVCLLKPPPALQSILNVLSLTFPVSFTPVLGSPQQLSPSPALTWAVEDLRDGSEAFGGEGLQGLVDTAEILRVGEDGL